MKDPRYTDLAKVLVHHSSQVKPGDKVAVLESSRKTLYFAELEKGLKSARTPGWLTVDARQLSGNVMSLPTREQIDTAVKEQLIIEFYSR